MLVVTQITRNPRTASGWLNANRWLVTAKQEGNEWKIKAVCSVTGLKSAANGESTDTLLQPPRATGQIDAAGRADERGRRADSQADEDDSAATAARGGKTRQDDRVAGGQRSRSAAAALFVGSPRW